MVNGGGNTEKDSLPKHLFSKETYATLALNTPNQKLSTKSRPMIHQSIKVSIKLPSEGYNKKYLRVWDPF